MPKVERYVFRFEFIDPPARFPRDGNKWIVRLPRIPPLNKIPQSDQSWYLPNEFDAFLICGSETSIASHELDRRQCLRIRFLGSDVLRTGQQ
jgi:hypothetical protein